MRTFVFAYDRYDSMTTSAMLEAEGLAHTVLCHTDEAAERFVAGGTVRAERLLVTGQPKGLAFQRNAALDLMDDGEWALFLVDDLRHVTELEDYDAEPHEVLPVDTTNSGEWQRRFRKRISMEQFQLRAQQTARVAERLGAHLGGFAGIDNALFRRRHWHLNVLADGRAWVVQRTHLRLDGQVHTIEDMAWTLANLRAFGVVLVNQWVLPDCRRYTEGGYGSIEARMHQHKAEAAYLVAMYPDLVRYKAKKGWPRGSHIVLRRVTPERVQG